MLNPKQLSNLTDAAAAAVQTERAYELPAELTLAQWALESDWGVELPPGSNNPFGIKAVGNQPFVQAETTEYINNAPQRVMANFRAFPSLVDAFNYHAELLTTSRIYSNAWQAYLMDHDLVGLIRGISAHYSTSPTYAQQLQNVLAMTVLTQQLALARQLPGPDSVDA
jgi:flagellum-specific peptidoglycan hydrolase FlgJ